MNRTGRPHLDSPLTTIVISVGTALIATYLLVYSTGASPKMLAGAVAGLLFMVVAFLSGNIRLFCLWAFLLTAPFDLSKRLGHIFFKMGGESSYRIEASDVFMLALVGFLINDWMTGRWKRLRVPRELFTWILLILLGCVWIAVSTWQLTAAHEVVRMLKNTLLFLVIINELRRPARLLHCALGLTLGVVVQSIAALLQYYRKANFGLDLLGETGSKTIRILASSSVEGSNVFRAGAFMSHPNVFGAFLAAVLPVTIGIFLLRLGKGRKLFALVTSTLGMAALITTLSRSGWVSFAAAFPVLIGLMLIHPGLRRRSIMAATVASLALLLVVAVFFGPITNRIFSSRDAAMLGRAEYTQDAMGMIRAKPIFGWGLNSYVFAVPPFTKYGPSGARDHYQEWIPPVHNIYLLWWSEIGIIGLALHLAFWGSIVLVGIRNLPVRDETMFMLNAVCLSAMVAFIVDGFFSFSLRFNSILRIYFVLAGMMVAIRYWRLENPMLPVAPLPGGKAQTQGRS